MDSMFRAYFLLLPLDTCYCDGIHDNFGQTLWNPFTWLHLAAMSNSWSGSLVWRAQVLRCFLELISFRKQGHVGKWVNILYESHLGWFNLNWFTSSLTTHFLLETAVLVFSRQGAALLHKSPQRKPKRKSTHNPIVSEQLLKAIYIITSTSNETRQWERCCTILPVLRDPANVTYFVKRDLFSGRSSVVVWVWRTALEAAVSISRLFTPTTVGIHLIPLTSRTVLVHLLPPLQRN